MNFDFHLDGHTFLLETVNGKWMAKTHVTKDKQTLAVEFFIPNDEDADFQTWYARIIELIETSIPEDMTLHEICHVGPDQTDETIS